MSDLSDGIYEQLVANGLENRLRMLEGKAASREPLDPADAHEVLARHLAELARRALRSAEGEDRSRVQAQVDLANGIASAIVGLTPEIAGQEDLVASPGDLLYAVARRVDLPGLRIFPPRPEVPLSTSALLVNGRGQPRIGSEVSLELASADQVDLLCAFVKFHCVRIVEEQIAALIQRGGTLRVITTTYMGATERKALDRLGNLGAKIKISYETRTTRLHAKAWLFHRSTGFSTAYVVSSNLSKSDLVDGLEWNVRLTSVEQEHLLDTFRATFEQYWEDPAFEYDPSDIEQRNRLDKALRTELAGPSDLPIEVSTIDVRPWPYQREILEQLTAERDLHGIYRNLVVMATGTGKTVVGGLDYRRLRAGGVVDSLLFVAHRDEILAQSVATFRHIMHAAVAKLRLGKPAWRYCSIAKILRNPAYVGTLYCNCVEVLPPQAGRKRQQRKRPQAEWIAISVPTIVSQETFDAAQQVRHDNSRFSPRRAEPGKWLQRSLVRCGACGVIVNCLKTVSGSPRPTSSVQRYYVCPHRDPLRAGGEDPRCREHGIRSDELDAFVFVEVRDALL